MNTILTSDEIGELHRPYGENSINGFDHVKAFARAIEAAALAKLAQQEPVAHFGSAYVNENGVHVTTVLGPVAIPQDTALYTHPAPQQADRQRVPGGHVLVPVEPTEKILKALGNAWDGANRATWQKVLAAAPEAPAQASAVDERDRKDAERYRWLREQMLGVDFDWDESGKTALCFEMPDGCSFAADCDQVIDEARAALAQKGGK